MAKILDLSNDVKNEKVTSACEYPSEYTAKPIEEQVSTTASIFGLDSASALTYVKSLPCLPGGAKGWFAVPSLTALAQKYFSDVDDPAEQYCRAVQLVHYKMATTRSFYNYRKGKIIPQHLRQSVRAVEFWQRVETQQPGNAIKIIAAQLGRLYRGYSVSCACSLFPIREFGLGSLSVGSIVLVHSERLIRNDELDMDCPGDEFSSGADGVFSEAPYFGFSDGQVEFDTYDVKDARCHFGSVSGFLVSS